MAKSYGEECPCRGCKMRKVGCHSKCIPYIDWKKSGIEIKPPDPIPHRAGAYKRYSKRR